MKIWRELVPEMRMTPADEASARAVSRIVSHVRDLDAAVAKADERRAQLLADLRALNGQLAELEEAFHDDEADKREVLGYANKLLLDFIGDPEVTAAHAAVAKWYS